jgi:hypothetical protein
VAPRKKWREPPAPLAIPTDYRESVQLEFAFIAYSQKTDSRET